MELTYRGNSYKYNPPALELAESGTGGKYRGADWSHRYLRHIPVPQTVANLKYRGVAYCSGDPVDIEASRLRQEYVKAEASIADSAIASTASKARSHREVLMDDLNSAHLNNIRRSLEHRIQVAQARGDQNLVRLLQAEVEQIV